MESVTMTTLDVTWREIQQFTKGSLRKRISTLEATLQGANKEACESLFSTQGINSTLLATSLVLKQASGQINEVVHSLGILFSLPHILCGGEVVEMLSLAAGNTGRSFDLETNLRVAEFKFIDWKGGPESIRQNQLFKDFYFLAELTTPKERYLYTVGLEHPLKFLRGGRALSSVMSRNHRLWMRFQKQYGSRFRTVADYYACKKSDVKLVDLAKIVPEFSGGID
jgi:hypothetical protein